MIGETIGGRYEIIRALGEGGMGAVFEAKHTGTGRRVALKTIHPDKVKSPQLLSRFQVEARAAGSIESEYVVQVFDVDVDQDRKMPFLAMEFLAGEDLDSVLERLGTLPPDLALRITAQVCLGLERAHSQGVLHRDIKPANLLLAERDGGEMRMKIVDFGLAKALSDSDQAKGPSLTISGMLLGSPQYMSPEQARGERAIDARTDVWSLGMVLYEMLTGRTAFQGVGTIPKVLEAITTQPVPPVRDTAPWVDAAVAAVVERALDRDKDRRFASIQELREALSPHLPSGLAFQKREIVAGPKPEAPRKVGNDAPTVAKPAGALPTEAKPAEAKRVPEKTEPGIPLDLGAAGAVAIRPTKVSGKQTEEGAQPKPPSTDPLPKQVIPVEPSEDKAATPKRRPAGGTLLSGAVPVTATAPAAPPEREPAPRTERVAAATTSAPAPAPPVRTPPPPPAAAPRRKQSPALAIGGVVTALGIAGGAIWYSQQGAPKHTASTATASARAQPSTASSQPAAAADTSTAGTAKSPLLGKWKSDSGRVLEAVEVAIGVEFRVAELKGFEDQGYALGERRFTLVPAAGGFRVQDHVRPLSPAGMTFDPSAKSACLLQVTEIDGAALTAALEGDVLAVSLTDMTPLKSTFEVAGNRVTSCNGLDKLKLGTVKSKLKRM